LDGERLLETRSPVGGSRRLARSAAGSRAESDTQAEPVNECVRGDWGRQGRWKWAGRLGALAARVRVTVTAAAGACIRHSFQIDQITGKPEL
jgi:hypothetical protein